MTSNACCRALVVALMRVAGKDVHTPHTREAGPLRPVWARYEEKYLVRTPSLPGRLLESYTTCQSYSGHGYPDAVWYVAHAVLWCCTGGMFVGRLLGSAEQASTYLLSAHGLPVCPSLATESEVKAWLDDIQGKWWEL